MAIETIKEYLVSLGFGVDSKSAGAAKVAVSALKAEMVGVVAAVGEIAVAVAAVGVGFVAAGAAVAAFGVSVSQIGKQLGNITTGVDKFALGLYTSRENARSLQHVMDAMGISSLNDLKYINLMPEQRQQFMELRKFAAELAPDEETKQGLAELRKFGFEFQKLQIQMASIGLKLLGALGNLMSTPLFKKVPLLVQVIVDILAFLVKQFSDNVKAFKEGGLPALGEKVRRQVRRAAEEVFPGEKVGGGSHPATKPSIPLFKPSADKKQDVEKFKVFAVEAAKKYGIDPSIFLAQIEKESHWDPKAKSKAGAMGIAQLMPGTAKSLGVNPYEPFAALDGAGRLMRQNLDRFKGNIVKALAAYNAGPGNVDRALNSWPETQDYVRTITQNAKRQQLPPARTISIRIDNAANPEATAQAVIKELKLALNTRQVQAGLA